MQTGANLLLSMLVASACSNGLGPVGGLVFRVTLSKDTVSAGEQIQIMVDVSNPADRTVEIANDCVPISFRVVDVAGTVVSPSPEHQDFGCESGLGNTVPAGGENHYIFQWSPFRNYGSAGPSVPLEAGDYFVIAGVEGDRFEATASPRVPLRVTS